MVQWLQNIWKSSCSVVLPAFRTNKLISAARDQFLEAVFPEPLDMRCSDSPYEYDYDYEYLPSSVIRIYKPHISYKYRQNTQTQGKEGPESCAGM